jgi:predicted membrane channel-forming protein YqfA (hemolysin III family)
MKPNKLLIQLFGIAGVFGILSWVATGTAKDWFTGIFFLAMAASLVVSLVGMVAERRALEAKRKADAK